MADNLAYQTEKTLKDQGDKLSDADRRAVEQALGEVKDALKSDDVARIKTASDALVTASHKLGRADLPHEPGPAGRCRECRHRRPQGLVGRRRCRRRDRGGGWLGPLSPSHVTLRGGSEMAVRRWDPFRDLLDIQDEINRDGDIVGTAAQAQPVRVDGEGERIRHGPTPRRSNPHPGASRSTTAGRCIRRSQWRRPGTNPPGAAPEPPAAPAAPAEPNPLEGQLEAARAEAAGYLDDLQRLKAEFDNYRKAHREGADRPAGAGIGQPPAPPAAGPRQLRAGGGLRRGEPRVRPDAEGHRDGLRRV